MNILIVIDKLKGFYGLENNITSLIKSWSKKNKVLVYADEVNKDLMKEFKTVSLISKWSHKNDEYIISNFKPDILLNYCNVDIKKTIELKNKLKDTKLYTIVHKKENIDFPDSFIKKNVLFIAISKYAKEAAKVSVPLDKIKVIYSGINTKQFYPTKKGLVLQKNLNLKVHWKTITVATRVTKKNINILEQIIRIAPILASRLGGLNLVICGDSDSSEHNYLKDLKAKVAKVNNLNIVFTGHVKNLRTHINLAELVLAGNRTAIEALLCNKKVFYMDHKWKCLVQNNNYEDILFSKNKFVDYEDEELVLHLTWMLKQEKNLEGLVDNLIEKITDLCDIEVVNKKYSKIFKEI